MILYLIIVVVAVFVVVNTITIVVIIIIMGCMAFINSITFVTDLAATQSWLLLLIAFRCYQLIHSSRKYTNVAYLRDQFDRISEKCAGNLTGNTAA